MRNRWLWVFTGTSAILAAIICISGFALAMKVMFDPVASEIMKQPDPPTAGSEAGIQIVALGDSLTRGYGDESGLGYAGQLRQMWNDAVEQDVFLINLGRNGSKTSQLLDLLEEPGTSVTVAEAETILLTIGANDLFSQTEEFVPEDIEITMEEVLRRVDQIFQRIRISNPDAPIYYIGLYNPFMDQAFAADASRIISKWNDGVFNLSLDYDNIYIVPTYDLFIWNMKELLSPDIYHPNEQGYKRIAERLAAVLQIDSLDGEAAGR